MELEERSIADLPDRCENCGAALTDAEKQAALERETTPVLCSICAAEVASALPDDADDTGQAY